MPRAVLLSLAIVLSLKMCIRDSYRDGQHDQLSEDWLAALDFADLVFFGADPADRDRLFQRPFDPPDGAIPWAAPQ